MKDIKDIVAINETYGLDKLKEAGASSIVLNLFNASHHSMADEITWDDLANVLSRVYKDLKK